MCGQVYSDSAVHPRQLRLKVEVNPEAGWRRLAAPCSHLCAAKCPSASYLPHVQSPHFLKGLREGMGVTCLNGLIEGSTTYPHETIGGGGGASA